MELSKFQKYFIRVACDIEEHVIYFNGNDADFEDFYGLTKEEVKKEIKELKEKLFDNAEDFD